MSELPLDRSYRALLAVPSLGRAIVGMQIARVAQSMLGVGIVLFTLSVYHSAPLTGLVSFVGIVPGLLVSPIAGALLDRHGRTRLIVLDFLVALASLSLIGLLSLAGMLPIWLLLLIAGISSLTQPLSSTGLRTLFPLMVPAHLWERVNAVDSNGYIVATIIGPPLAAVIVSVWGGPEALIVMAVMFGVAAFVVRNVPEPPSMASSSGRLLADAWAGLVYTWRNRTLRGLGVSISVLNLAGGMISIVVPIIVLQRLHLPAATVGLVFAVQGAFGVVAGFVSGGIDTRDRERRILAVTMLGYAAATALLLSADRIELVIASMAIAGLVAGPMDVAMFTVRQRRTDPAWIGRAFAVSMSFNFAGYPIGSALTGWIVGSSIQLAVGLGVVACLAGAILALALVPERAPAVGADRRIEVEEDLVASDPEGCGCSEADQTAIGA